MFVMYYYYIYSLSLSLVYKYAVGTCSISTVNSLFNF